MARLSLTQRISDLQQDTLRMGALVETAVAEGIQALLTCDLALAERVIAQDDLIDRYYRKLEVDCLDILAFHSPLARDLRHIGTLLQLIRDLERIGDYTVDICETIPDLANYPQPSAILQVRGMAYRCQQMVTLSLTTLTNLDPTGGKQLVRADDAVDADYANLYHTLATQKVGLDPVEPLLLLLLIIRYLERMADHATNIGLRVAFIVTGER